MSLVLIRPLPAQQYNIRTFTTSDGLAHNDVRAIASDSFGFLWIATWDGLSRYDGYTFKNYYHNNSDSLSIPYFSILNIMVDGGDNLWLLTDDNVVAKYDRDNDHFIRLDHLYNDLPENYIHISIDESGYLWLINSEALYKFDFRKNEFVKFEVFEKEGEPIKKYPDGIQYTVSTKENGKLWLVSHEIFEFKIISGNKLILENSYKIEAKSTFRNADFNYIYWYRIYFTESGKKWICSNSGLYLLDEKSGIFLEYRDPFAVNDFPGNTFFCWSWNDDGIYLYDQNRKNLTHIPKDDGKLVKSIFYQNKDLFWFSNLSYSGAAIGLNRIVFTPGYFKNYPLEVEKNDIPVVFAISKDKDNNLYVGLRGGIPVLQITPAMRINKIKIPDSFLLKDAGSVRSLTTDEDGVWIGFFRELLLFYNFTTRKIIRYTPESVFFRPIAIDKEGELYLVSGNNKIIRFSPELQKTSMKWPYSPVSPIYKILVDEEGIVWACMSQSKFLRLDPRNDKLDIFSILKDNYNIEDLCQGDNGDIWLALLGGGVCRFNPKTGSKTFYSTSNGLTNNMTYSLLKDKTGNIWVSTNTGISRINPETGQIRGFGINDGLSINEFNSGASFKDEKGEFFMGGMGGLVGFFPDSISNELGETTEQRIIINEIRVSGESKRYKRSVKAPDTVYLNKGQNNIQIYFSSSDFINSQKTLYRHKLSKINEDWIETDHANRSINYANLKPGWYSLLLQATDRGGSWNAEKEIKILIKPRYHETLLFRIMVPGLFILLIASWIHFYIRQLNQKAARKQDALRLQSLQGQMNPHFIFNSLNSINYFISKNDALSANRYIADFSKLIRSILYNFNSDFVSLEKEIESVEDYLKIEHLRFGDKFNYRVVMNQDIPLSQIKVSPGFIQPFVENAIWHGVRGLSGRKGNIVVTYSWDNEKLICTVEDDGIGRKKAEILKSKIDRKVSRGIHIVTERLNIINKLQNSNYQIIISDLNPEIQETGTRVLIGIPVKKS